MDRFLHLPRPSWLYHRLKLRLRSLESIELDKVQESLAEYGLRLTATPRIPAVVGRSHSLIVDTSLGKKVLKRYMESVSLPAIIHEHSILNYLAQVDFPAPRLVATRTGETLVHRQGITYALFDFIEGYTQYHNLFLLPAQARRFTASAGNTLAALHEQLKDFVPAGQHPDGFKSLQGDRWRDLEWYDDKLAYCIAQASDLNTATDEASATNAILSGRAGWIRDTLHQLDHELKPAGLPRLIIHGDYGSYNLLHKQNAPAVVLDFELARLDWRVTDLAKAIPNFAYHRRLGFNFSKMNCFLDAYQARYPISDGELQFMPVVWRFLHIRRLIVCWYNYCNTRANRWVAAIQKHLNWVDWIANNRGKLLAEFHH